MRPSIPIEVDATTGVWSTDGLPMLYVPRHFFMNNHLAIESALGRERYAALLYDAGYRSAHYWCASESVTHGLTALSVFEYYLKRLSQRGWGQFSFLSVDEQAQTAEIRLQHSAFVLANAQQGRLCYMFAGWFAGAMDWVLDPCAAAALTQSTETQCAGEGHTHCVFSVRPRRDPAID